MCNGQWLVQWWGGMCQWNDICALVHRIDPINTPLHIIGDMDVAIAKLQLSKICHCHFKRERWKEHLQSRKWCSAIHMVNFNCEMMCFLPWMWQCSLHWQWNFTVKVLNTQCPLTVQMANVNCEFLSKILPFIASMICNIDSACIAIFELTKWPLQWLTFFHC